MCATSVQTSVVSRLYDAVRYERALLRLHRNALKDDICRIILPTPEDELENADGETLVLQPAVTTNVGQQHPIINRMSVLLFHIKQTHIFPRRSHRHELEDTGVVTGCNKTFPQSCVSLFLPLCFLCRPSHNHNNLHACARRRLSARTDT